MKRTTFATAAALAFFPLPVQAQPKTNDEVCIITKADVAAAATSTHSTNVSTPDGRAEIILQGNRVLLTVSDAIRGIEEASAALRKRDLPSADCALADAKLSAMSTAGNLAARLEAKKAQENWQSANGPAASVRDTAIKAAQEAYDRAMEPANAAKTGARDRAAALAAAALNAPRVPRR